MGERARGHLPLVQEPAARLICLLTHVLMRRHTLLLQAGSAAGAGAAQCLLTRHVCDGHAEPAVARHRCAANQLAWVGISRPGISATWCPCDRIPTARPQFGAGLAPSRPRVPQPWRPAPSHPHCQFLAADTGVSVNAVLCWNPLYPRNHLSPAPPVFADTDVAMNAVLALGFIGAGTNNARWVARGCLPLRQTGVVGMAARFARGSAASAMLAAHTCVWLEGTAGVHPAQSSSQCAHLTCLAVLFVLATAAGWRASCATSAPTTTRSLRCCSWSASPRWVNGGARCWAGLSLGAFEAYIGSFHRMPMVPMGRCTRHQGYRWLIGRVWSVLMGCIGVLLVSPWPGQVIGAG